MLNEVAEILSNVKMILSQEDILSDKHDPSVQLKNLQHKLSAASELLTDHHSYLPGTVNPVGWLPLVLLSATLLLPAHLLVGMLASGVLTCCRG